MNSRMDNNFKEGVQRAAGRTDFTMTPDAALELAARLVECAREAMKNRVAFIQMPGPYLNMNFNAGRKGAQATHFPGFVQINIHSKDA